MICEQDKNDLDKIISTLKSTEEKFFKAFHASSVIMVVFTVDEGRIVDVNEAGSRITGYSSGELIGKTIKELNLYPDDTQRKHIQTRIKESGQISDFELTIRTKQGESRHVLFSMDALNVDSTACVLAAGSDFTLRKQAEDKLKKAYAELNRQKKIIEKKSREIEAAKEMIEKEARLVEESSRHKSEFLASMSHELRTPLNSIILLSDLLERNSDGNLTEKDVEFVSIIKSAGKDLLALINDMLDISRVESGRMDINLSKMSLEYFSRKISGYFTEMAAVKGLSFSIRSEPGLTDYILTDIQKLEQIVKNLLSNAIKFTEKGVVELVIHRPNPENDLSCIGLDGIQHLKTIAFSVKDSGIGIPDEKIEDIFELYRQADSSILKKYGGTGLGLPVSRVLAQLLGGDILVESEYGKGSIFTFYLPETKMDDPEPEDEHTEPSAVMIPNDVFYAEVGKALAGRIVLIADDDMRTSYALMQSMDMYETEIIVASDGEKCLQKLADYPDTDILLLDIAMPEKDGFEILGALRNSEAWKKLPVIAITAKAMQEDKERCLKLGADAFFSKPIDMKALLHAMAGLLKVGK